MEEFTNPTPIQNKYAFWFRGGSTNAPKVGYNESIKKIASFQTVEHFWQVYDHLKRPSAFPMTTEYHLFKDGIHPTWEDPQNQAGGKWMIRLKKGIASRYWEEVVLAIIGEQFDVGPEICGAVCSVRHGEDIISVWNKTADNAEAVNKIRDQLRRILKLPSIIQIEYKRHQDSLVDKSSYRNPTVVWKAPTGPARPERAAGHQGDKEGHQGGGGHREYNKGGDRGSYQQHGEKGWSSSGASSRGTAWQDRNKGGAAAESGSGFRSRNGPGGNREGGGWSRGAAIPGQKEGGKLRSTSDGEAPATASAPPVPSTSGSRSNGGVDSTSALQGYKRVPFPGVHATASATAPTAAPAKSTPPPANAWGRPAN